MNGNNNNNNNNFIKCFHSAEQLFEDKKINK